MLQVCLLQYFVRKFLGGVIPLKPNQSLETRLVRHEWVARIGNVLRNLQGIVEIGKRTFIHLCFQKGNSQSCGVASLGSQVVNLTRDCHGGANIFARSLEIAVVENRNSNLRKSPILPMHVAYFRREGAYLLPILAGSPCIQFAINITFDNKAEKPQRLIVLEESIGSQLRFQLGRREWEVPPLYGRPDLAKVCIQGIPPVPRCEKALLCSGEVRPASTQLYKSAK